MNLSRKTRKESYYSNLKKEYYFSTRRSLQNPLYATKKHVFACFAHAQLCISSFACKLLCTSSTLTAEVNIGKNMY